MRKLRRKILENSGRILILSVVLAILGGIATAKLYAALRPDLEELLPKTAPSVMDAKKIEDRLVSSDYLALLVFSPDPKKGSAFIVDLAQHLEEISQTSRGDLISYVEYESKLERDFFLQREGYYIDEKDLNTIADYIPRRLQYEKDKSFGGLLGVHWEEPRFDFNAFKKKYRLSENSVQKDPKAEFATSDGKARALLIGIRNERKNVQGYYALRAVVDKAIADEPTDLKKGLELHFTGGVEDSLEEQAGLVSDLSRVTGLVLFFTLLAIYVFFGSALSMMALLASLIVGALSACGLFYLLVGYVNMNSAFLGSIIIGNGINFGIILVARILEELRKGRPHLRAIVAGLKMTARATLTAALAAGVAYGSLTFTNFRGFQQFGLMAFIGMIFCWTAAYTVCPAVMLVWLSRKARTKALEKPSSALSQKASAPFGALGRFIDRKPAPILIGTLVLSVLGIFLVFYRAGSYFETDLTRMRNVNSLKSGSGYYSKYLHEIFAGYPHPLVILAPTDAEARLVHEALEKAEAKKDSLIGKVLGIPDLVPVEQIQKQPLLKKIRDEVRKNKSHLSSDDDAINAFMEMASHANTVSTFGIHDLPESILRKLRERDGTLGKVVLVEPIVGKTESVNELLGFIKEVRGAVRAVSPGAAVSGTLAVSADLVESISREGPKLTILAFVFVFLLALMHFKQISFAGALMASLLIGVYWMFCGLSGFGMRLNFLNFIALPMTFGIALDYGVNVLERHRLEPRSNMSLILSETGGAVFLASFTTILGYGGLLLAANQAIWSFGALAMTGEFTCLATALFVIPAWISWKNGDSGLFKRKEKTERVKASFGERGGRKTTLAQFAAPAKDDRGIQGPL